LTTILLLDNRDSFTFNLAQVLGGLGAQVRVRSSRETDLAAIRAEQPNGILVGPGPGRPEAAGCSEDVMRDATLGVPILGVCLGHQALATALGGSWSSASELVHGQSRRVEHDGRGIFKGLPSPLEIARYNSLAVRDEDLPPELEVSAHCAGEIFGLRHRSRPIESLQGHPESILCVEPHGRTILRNWLRMCGHTTRATDPATGPATGPATDPATGPATDPAT
jgi:para-aminobenzoate synthetase component II